MLMTPIPPAAPVDSVPTAPAVPPTVGPAQPIRWPLPAGLCMLNHGSYGVTPQYVRERQAMLRSLMDADPVRWFKTEMERWADRARRAVAQLINCPPRDLVFVPNATIGNATILYSMNWNPGDEIVITDHEYQATINELERLSHRTGCVVRRARVPLPCEDPAQITESIAMAITKRTKLVIVSHVTSATSLVQPVAEIVAMARARGVDTLVDGAHGPGHIDVDVAKINPAYYTGSGHKWLCAPKGSGMMYVAPEKQPGLRPLALSSRAANDRIDRPKYWCDFDYVGTGDQTANLVLADCIEHIAAQDPDGLPGVRRRNHALLMRGATLIAERCGLRFACRPQQTLHIATLILPADPAPDRPRFMDDPLWDLLLDKHGIQVPIWTFAPTGHRVVRVSAHLHNRIEDFERLADALAIELEAEQRLA